MASTQLVLTIEAQPGQPTLERLRAALNATRFASVIVRPGRLQVPVVRSIVELTQSVDVAAIVASDVDLARATGADGVHIQIDDTSAGAVATARAALGKGQIVGVDASGSRHAAMIAGEAGADYLAFGGMEGGDHISWWSEVFEVPCVALGDTGGMPDRLSGVATPHDAARLVSSGADFVAIALPLAQTAGDVQASMRAFASAVSDARAPA